jgi:hypothetical protein
MRMRSSEAGAPFLCATAPFCYTVRWRATEQMSRKIRLYLVIVAAIVVIEATIIVLGAAGTHCHPGAHPTDAENSPSATH